MKKIFAIAVVVTALSLVLGGCNKGEDANANSSASPSASAAGK